MGLSFPGNLVLVSADILLVKRSKMKLGKWANAGVGALGDAWLSRAVDLLSELEAGLVGASPRRGLVPASLPRVRQPALRGPQGSPSTASIGAETPALPCKILLFVQSNLCVVGCATGTVAGVEVDQLVNSTTAEMCWRDRRDQRVGGARERVGTEVLCLKMYGDPLNNFDKLLAVRFEANHRIFLKLCYLEGTTPFSPTGKWNSQVGLLAVEYSNVFIRNYYSGCPVLQNWVPSLTSKSHFCGHFFAYIR